jgi:hypothetical protein
MRPAIFSIIGISRDGPLAGYASGDLGDFCVDFFVVPAPGCFMLVVREGIGSPRPIHFSQEQAT